MIRNVLKTLTSFRAILVAAAGIPFALAPSAHAQAPDAAGTATAGAVIVTGSNIPTAEEVTPSNVDTLTDQDVKRSGQATDILNVLTRTDPDFVGTNEGQSNAVLNTAATYGGSIVSIRGLPALVLLDGRRIADSAAISAGGFQFTNVSLFPTSMVSRIEVLKDGASALYGSEAVGGVINIFLKTDFTGFEMGFRYGSSLEGRTSDVVNGAGNVAERRAYAIAGVGNETTHVMAGFQYYEIDPLFSSDRVWSAFPVIFPTSNYGGSVRDLDGVVNQRYLLNPALNSPFAAGVIPGSATSMFSDAALLGTYDPHSTAFITGGVAPAFNPNLKPTLTLKERNTSEIASFTHDIFGKQLEVFGDMMFASNDNWSQLNGQPVNTTTGVNIPAGGAANPGVYNPFPTDIFTGAPSDVLVSNRYNNGGLRTFKNDDSFYRLLGGVRSQINKDWFFETAFYYSHDEINYVNGGLVTNEINQLIAGTDPNFPGMFWDFFARNPVGEAPAPGAPAGTVPLSQEAFQAVFQTNFRQLTSYQKVMDARLTGFPFELPGGGVGLSVGAEYRDEGFKLQDSPEIFLGSVPIAQIDRGRGISSYYGEIRIPIVGSEMHVPFIYSLELSGAGRHDHYEGVVKDADVPKVTLRYQPFQDLTIRSTYSNSFVAPTLYQLFGPQSQGFSNSVSLGGVTQDQPQVLAGSNPNLIPATAESYTAGLVYSPHFVPGLTVTGDFFKTLYQGIVGAIPDQTIVSSIDNLGPASPYAAQGAFFNFPGRAGAQPITAPGQLFNNTINFFFTNLQQNLGAARETGFDFSIRYLWDLKAWGQLEVGANAVYFLSQDFKNFPNSDFYTINGAIGDENFGANPVYSVTWLGEYRVMGFTLSVNGRYLPPMFSETAGDISTGKLEDLPQAGAYMQWDGRLAYEFKRTPQPIAAPMGKDAKDSKGVASGTPGVAALGWGDKLLDGLSLAVGCNNMFDRQPPFVFGTNQNTNLGVYDPFGRFVYFEIAHKF